MRGFEKGKIGPKDGNDHIGGNYVTALNFNSTLPFIFENIENLDVLFFFDAANVWGVDYDSSLNDANEIRSSTGIGLDWLTPIGPMSFVFSQPISKATLILMKLLDLILEPRFNENIKNFNFNLLFFKSLLFFQ